LRDQHNQGPGQIVRRQGTVLYSDLGNALFAVVEDSYGRHDTIYGCRSKPNNFLRCRIRGTHSCFGNFVEALPQFGLDRSYIVTNVNFFMSVPVAPDSAAGNVYGHSAAANCRSARRARRAGSVVKLSANAQSLQCRQPGANPRDHLAAIAERQAVASLGRGERS
jgi:hypothetical protein